jgi:hypothetical protein
MYFLRFGQATLSTHDDGYLCLHTVKFFGGEDGRPWKSNVKDVGGELLLVCTQKSSIPHMGYLF